MTEDRVSLETIGGGAAIEKFDDELQRVADNIIDPNTDPKAVREVTLKIKIKPDAEREWGSVTISATSKLAPMQPYPTQVILGKRGGKGVMVEYNPKQMKLSETPVGDNVVPMEKKKEGGEK